MREGSINSEKFKEFVEGLVHGKKRKVFLILDNAKTHDSKVLTEWAEENGKRQRYFIGPRGALT